MMSLLNLFLLSVVGTAAAYFAKRICRAFRRSGWIVALPIFHHNGADLRAVKELAVHVPATHHLFIIATPVVTRRINTYAKAARLYREIFHRAGGVATLHFVVFGIDDSDGSSRHPHDHFLASRAEFRELVRNPKVVILTAEPPTSLRRALCGMEPMHKTNCVTPFDRLITLPSADPQSFITQCFEQHFEEVYQFTETPPANPLAVVGWALELVDDQDDFHLLWLAVVIGFLQPATRRIDIDAVAVLSGWWQEANVLGDVLAQQALTVVFGDEHTIHNSETIAYRIKTLEQNLPATAEAIAKFTHDTNLTKLLALRVLKAERQPDNGPAALIKFALDLQLHRTYRSTHYVTTTDAVWCHGLCTTRYTVRTRPPQPPTPASASTTNGCADGAD
jgi:hypothetical protein